MSTIQTLINKTVEEAQEAYCFYKSCSGKQKAKLLRLIAENIEAIGDELILTATEESLLPETRIRGERSRTTGQLTKFADLLEEGSWVEATIDTADHTGSGVDLRKMLIPTGPVVVFGAGNFPLAFSVAGGDTASALAAGNPVVVKAHPDHPQTGKLVALAIWKSIEQLNWPKAIFGFIEDSGHEAGAILVQHPMTKSVAFTGSFKGGMALLKLAAQRPEPIPVFTEMGSINPVIILPDALQKHSKKIAKELVNSINLGAGQFCTNPGLILVQRHNQLDEFLETLADSIQQSFPNGMYSDNVFLNYKQKSDCLIKEEAISLLSKGAESNSRKSVSPSIATVNAKDFIQYPHFQEEVFGPFSLVVICDSAQELQQVTETIGGQLTGTLQATENDLKENGKLVNLLKEKCGRILFNGVPTGVEVCAAMQHGGPFPAASDSRFTSVGVNAIKRFVRPISYQDFPQFALPEELQNHNPLEIWRKINNKWSKD